MKKFLSLVLALVMTMSLVTISAGAKDFTDDSTIKYDEAVDVMSAVKVIDGYTDGSFKPAATLTRGAAAKIICNMILGPTTAAALSADAAPYSDVPANHVFAGYISYCAKEGIISGYADGTFRPAGTLTGYAFMKMLLGALGYDAAIEGYTGANWSIAVAKRALNVGLDDGNADFVGTKAVTREEACLYAFNTLKADMVEYKDKSSIVIGDVSIVTNADAKKTGETFAEAYFSKLSSKADHDDFGRPATTWTYKSKEVGTYADKADASYSKKVDGKTLYSDLGLDKNIKAADVDEIINGADAVNKKSITKKDEDTKFGANGVLTEVFLQKKDDAVVGATVVEISTYVGEVTDVDTNKDDERYIEIDKDLTYVTEEFEEDDIVLYTATVDDEVQSVVPAEKLTGKLTKISGSKYTIDGNVYSLSAENELGKISVKDEVEFYLDAYGYIIKMDATDDEVTADNIAYVLAFKEDKFDGNRAKLLFADGTKKTVDVYKTSGTVDEGAVVSFKTNDDGEYKLTAESAKDVTVKKGAPKLATGVTANSKTLYAYYLTDKNGDTSVDTYTGYKTAPTVNGGTAVAYVEKGKAVVVFVIAKDTQVDASSSSDELTFIAVDAKGDITDDGDNKYYTFSAVVDGKVTELDVAVDAVDNIKADGVYAFKSYKTKDGIVTSLTPKTDAFKTAKTVSVDDDVITLGGEALAYTDDVLVLFVDDNEFSTGTVNNIKSKAGTYSAIQYTLDDGDVDVIILTKAD